MGSLEAELFGLATRLNQVAAANDRHATSLDELEDVLTELAALGPPPAAPSAQAALPLALSAPAATAPDTPTDSIGELPSREQLRAWVDTHVAPLVRKTTTTGEGGGLRWCRAWEQHCDAVDRFTALLLVHRELAAENAPSWRSVFLRDHLDPHLAQLTSPHGPFHACHPRRHSPTAEPLGHDQHHEHQARAGVPPSGGTNHDQHQPPSPTPRRPAVHRSGAHPGARG